MIKSPNRLSNISQIRHFYCFQSIYEIYEIIQILTINADSLCTLGKPNGITQKTPIFSFVHMHKLSFFGKTFLQESKTLKLITAKNKTINYIDTFKKQLTIYY